MSGSSAMKIEIMFDPVYHAAESHLCLNENHEILPDGEFIHWAKRFSGIDDIFQYRHKVTGNFVLAKWVYHPEKNPKGFLKKGEIEPALEKIFQSLGD